MKILSLTTFPERKVYFFGPALRIQQSGRKVHHLSETACLKKNIRFYQYQSISSISIASPVFMMDVKISKDNISRWVD